jgi:hypothetical protein
MNGKIKIHKPTGPAFNVGEVWYSAGGNLRVEIIGVNIYPYATKFPTEARLTTNCFEVSYLQSDGTVAKKDAWCFQVRYSHQADIYL